MNDLEKRVSLLEHQVEAIRQLLKTIVDSYSKFDSNTDELNID